MISFSLDPMGSHQISGTGPRVTPLATACEDAMPAKRSRARKKATSQNRSRSMAEKLAKALAVLGNDLPNPFDEVERIPSPV